MSRVVQGRITLVSDLALAGSDVGLFIVVWSRELMQLCLSGWSGPGNSSGSVETLPVLLPLLG